MKKTCYLLMSMILGVMISFLVHLPFVLAFLRQMTLRCEGSTPVLGIFCLFPTWALCSVLITGIIGGYFLGQTWWRIVYIEKRHWRMQGKNRPS
jgi:hypothetical protein